MKAPSKHHNRHHRGNVVNDMIRCPPPTPPTPSRANIMMMRSRYVPKLIILVAIVPSVLYNFLEFSKGWQLWHRSTTECQSFAEQQQQQQPRKLHEESETVHFMFGLHGSSSSNNDAEFFFDEWEVALKSLLLNAPIDNPLHIHIIANQMGNDAVRQRLQQHKLIGSWWRNPITITVYNVEQRQNEFRTFLQYHLRGTPINPRVSVGGYYRLLSPMILPKGIGPVAYMDTDAVIMTNVGELWNNHVNSSYTFQGSATWLCSAFIIINMNKAMKFWDLLDTLPDKRVDGKGDSSDQTLLQMVTQAHPELLGPLPTMWDTHLGHGHRRRPHDTLGKRPNGVGFLHFNGVRPNYFSATDSNNNAVGLQHYCDRTPECRGNPQAQKIFEHTWMLANYYIQIPWEWAMYIGGISKIRKKPTTTTTPNSNTNNGHTAGGGGHPLRFVEIISNSTTTSWIPPPSTNDTRINHSSATTTNRI